VERTFGQILVELRRTKGISQRQLAASVGIDFSYVSKLENDRMAPPAADTIVRICEALSVPISSLLCYTGKVPSQLKQMVGESPAALEFLREARSMNLSEAEWESLIRRLKRLRKAKKRTLK
jgi:HTH-type transcriptional regulator, competence development regulator